jgi:uncharacterized protein YyaL (SSP411 family)
MSYLPNSTLQWIQPHESIEKIAPMLQGKRQVNGKAAAYVCHDFTCSAPVTEVSELRALLEG